MAEKTPGKGKIHFGRVVTGYTGRGSHTNDSVRTIYDFYRVGEDGAIRRMHVPEITLASIVTVSAITGAFLFFAR